MIFTRPRSFNGAAILAGWLLLGCAQTGAERSAAHNQTATAAGWKSQIIRTGFFDLQAYSNRQPLSEGVLTVYIEGDGYAWVDGRFPSDDPTPVQAVGLQLAMSQPSGAVAYLGRPCQYLGADTDSRCNKKVWTDARFSAAAVKATNESLDKVKSQKSARQLVLVGYSGGAAIALLAAAERNDVTRIITVAGNLDPHGWAQEMRLQPLTGSLDTVAVITKTAHIPQVDFVGGKDRVVPPRVAEAFVQRYPASQRPRVITVPDNGHVCCWSEQWPKLWQQVQDNAS